MKKDGDLAELIGIHIGDGCISKTKRYEEYYLGGDIKEEKEYHDEWVAPLFNKKISKPILDRNVSYKEHPKVGIYGFHIFDKKLVLFFNKLGVPSGRKLNIEIPKWIIKDKKLTMRFLRGLFDTDGNIYFDKNRTAKEPINNRPTIKLSTVSRLLASQVKNSLEKLGMNPRLKKPYLGKRDKNQVHVVLIYRKDDVNYFIEKIGFKNPKHSTKWKVYKKLGYCPPRTTLRERLIILGSKNIYKFPI